MTRGDVLNHLVFFVIVVTLFRRVGPEPNLMHTMAPGIVWSRHCLRRCFHCSACSFDWRRHAGADAISAHPLLIVIGKIIAHWFMSGLPLTLLAPVLSNLIYLIKRYGCWRYLCSSERRCSVCSGRWGAHLGVRGGGVLFPAGLPLRSGADIRRGRRGRRLERNGSGTAPVAAWRVPCSIMRGCAVGGLRGTEGGIRLTKHDCD